MKALSIHPFYADMIVSGIKTIEVRTWKTDYRGDILICSTNKLLKGTIPGHALGIVELKDVVPMQKKHCEAAMMDQYDFEPNRYFAWILDNNRIIEPIPVKGKLSLWNFDEEEKIKLIPESEWALQDGEEDTGEPGEWYHKFWEPIII